MAEEKPRDSILPTMTIENLVIEVHTLVIKGKPVKPALIRQFVSENLIDAQGPTLRGIPLAWHTLHDKQCAELPSHIHLLWKKGNVYRVALVLDSWEQEKQYEQSMERLEQRKDDLCDLLALVLAQEHRYEIPSTSTHQSHTLEIGAYSLSISSNVSYHLRLLEEARRQQDQDKIALLSKGREEAMQQARDVRMQLLDQGIVLGHPTLNSSIDDQTLLFKSYGSYSKEDSDAYGENEYPSSKRSQVRWGWKSGSRGNKAPAHLKDLLIRNEPGLLAVLSDLIVQYCLLEVQQEIEARAKALHVELSDMKAQRYLEGSIQCLALSAEKVWSLYEETERQGEKYSQTWHRLYQQLHMLQQVFIDG